MVLVVLSRGRPDRKLACEALSKVTRSRQTAQNFSSLLVIQVLTEMAQTCECHNKCTAHEKATRLKRARVTRVRAVARAGLACNQVNSALWRISCHLLCNQAAKDLDREGLTGEASKARGFQVCHYPSHNALSLNMAGAAQRRAPDGRCTACWGCRCTVTGSWHIEGWRAPSAIAG